MEVASMAHSVVKTAPPVHVQAAYAVFGLGAWVVFSHAAGGEFSAVLTLAVVFQCLALALLALQVLVKGSAVGVSARALTLDAAALCLRLSSTTWLNGYLPVDMTGDWIYQAFDVASLMIVAWLLHQVLVVHKHTYQATDDSLAACPFILVSLALAAALHADMNSRPLFDALWMAGLFVSTVAVLPQLWLIMRSNGRCEVLTSHHIAAMAVSRLLSGTFMWHARHDITCDPWVEGWNHAVWAILGSHALHLVFLTDFVYYYAKAVLRDGLANCRLQLSGESLV